MDKFLPWIKPLQDQVSLLPANYKHVPRGPPSFTQGHPSPFYPYQITLCKVILAEVSQFSCPSPHRQSTLSHPPEWLPFINSSRATHTHSHCAVSSTAPSASLFHTPTPIHHPLFLTQLLPYSGHNTYPNRSSEWVSKGKGKMCPLPDGDHRDSKQQQLESQDISLDHHPIDILVLIFTHTFCLCQQ